MASVVLEGTCLGAKFELSWETESKEADVCSSEWLLPCLGDCCLKEFEDIWSMFWCLAAGLKSKQQRVHVRPERCTWGQCIY